MVMRAKLLYRISVRGIVQGVGFRWSASTEARNRGINGLIRNLSDGSVYIEAEGYKDQLDSYVEWCRKNPGFSVVESVEVNSSSPANYSDFRIDH